MPRRHRPDRVSHRQLDARLAEIDSLIEHNRWKGGKLEQAEALLRPLLTRKRFNIQEFGFFCQAQMELLLAKQQPEGAQSWLGMWSGIDPDNPLIGEWRRRLSGRNPLSRLLGKTY